ncbi:MAG: hypothetical protein GXO91_02985 [FCB group bacterium]|nr:hypothetical protein [FCB group bacterium]
MADKMKIIISGGGTGGHLFPALALGELLAESGAEVLYMGSEYGLEAVQLPKMGIEPVLLNIRGLQRGMSLKSILMNLAFPYRFLTAYLRAREVIREFDPQVVVGTGGYSSGLPLLAAIRLGKKTLIQEQNSYPGMTVRKLADKVDRICLGFSEAANYLKKKIGSTQEIL